MAVLSKPLLSEYRDVLTDHDLVARYPELEERKVRTAIERLKYVGDTTVTAHVRFEYLRDRKDEKLITLTIAAEATHLITTDRDLLDLPGGRDEAAKRFRQRVRHVAVLPPEEFVRRHGDILNIARSKEP